MQYFRIKYLLKSKDTEENFGVIYANDGEDVEFTHKTIKVALGLLMIEDFDFREKIKGELDMYERKMEHLSTSRCRCICYS